MLPYPQGVGYHFIPLRRRESEHFPLRDAVAIRVRVRFSLIIRDANAAPLPALPVLPYEPHHSTRACLEPVLTGSRVTHVARVGSTFLLGL